MAGDGLVGRPVFGAELDPVLAFRSADVAGRSQIGTSTASVTESFASMKR
jgi:hypothetical protein